MQSILYPHDIQEVLKIRLSDRVPEDFVAWYYEKSGIFLVRSAYHLAVQIEKRSNGQPGI
jgi:hypothetical protein